MSKQANLIDRIVSSPFFEKAMVKAESVMANDKMGLLRIVQHSLKKVSELAAQSNLTVVRLLNHYVLLFSEMIKAYVQGRYKKLPAVTLVKIVAVLFYFVSPFDFIPDVLPLIGFTDDLALVLWVGKSIKHELDEFEKHANV
ncbi:YkvA family protein [Aquirufa sp. OSTEICH-129V]|jgi:uncharacterized membrane protein YkvA (DUF1232 family)|uniref:YkvA family protein n=1 Tax=Aquirufa avitistagni TaxID=3104728 RepID=A0ABW6DAG1_9BACT